MCVYGCTLEEVGAIPASFFYSSLSSELLRHPGLFGVMLLSGKARLETVPDASMQKYTSSDSMIKKTRAVQDEDSKRYPSC